MFRVSVLPRRRAVGSDGIVDFERIRDEVSDRPSLLSELSCPVFHFECSWLEVVDVNLCMPPTDARGIPSRRLMAGATVVAVSKAGDFVWAEVMRAGDVAPSSLTSASKLRALFMATARSRDIDRAWFTFRAVIPLMAFGDIGPI